MIWRLISVVGSVIATAVVAAADVPAPAVADNNAGYDWLYIIRGVIFIFSSCLAMVWLGRRWSKRAEKTK